MVVDHLELRTGMANISKLSNRYMWQGLCLGMLLTCVSYAVASFDATEDRLGTLSIAILIAFCFFMLVNVVEAVVWRRVAENSPESLPTFFTAFSGGRMLLALATMFVYYLVVGRASMLPFFVVFMVFYVAQLVHHSIFFSRAARQLDEPQP